jgi:hypothetical protein
MALVPIKTASTTGYCDCICGCYELASLRDDETGKGFCPRCSKEHLEMNAGLGLPRVAPSRAESGKRKGHSGVAMPPPADPPARLR